MLATGFTRPVKDYRVLVAGGLLTDIGITGTGHCSEIFVSAGGSGHNVADVLSRIGHTVHLLSVNPFEPIEHRKRFEYSLIPVSKSSTEGMMIFRDDSDVIAVQKPAVQRESDQLMLLLESFRVDLLYITLELSHSFVNLVNRISHSYSILDLKPSFRISEIMEELKQFDAVLANEEEQDVLGDYDSANLVRMKGRKGVRFCGEDYGCESSSGNKLGCGDLLGAVIGNELISGRSLKEAVKNACMISSHYAAWPGSLDQYVSFSLSGKDD